MNKNDNKNGIPVYLSEKEIRVIKVALWKHWNNITDDNGDAYQEKMQPFVNCCYETYQTFESLDDEKKKFDELDKKCSFDEITLKRKFVIDESTLRRDKLFGEIIDYNVDDKLAIMHAYIDGNGFATAYNGNKDRYWSNTRYCDPEIPKPVLNKLCELARHQVIEDYKLSLMAKDYKLFINKNQKTGGNITVRTPEPEKYCFDDWKDANTIKAYLVPRELRLLHDVLTNSKLLDNRLNDDCENAYELYKKGYFGVKTIQKYEHYKEFIIHILLAAEGYEDINILVNNTYDLDKALREIGGKLV